MSSIFDALKKLEDEKSARESPVAGGNPLRTPPPGGGRRGLFPWLIVLLVIVAGSGIYLAGREDEEPLKEAPATLAEAVLARAGEDQRAAADPAVPPAEGPPPGVSPGPQAFAPSAPLLSEEQKHAREQLLARIAKFRKESAAMKGEEGEGAAPVRAVPAQPREPARLTPVYPKTSAPDVEGPAPPPAVAQVPVSPPPAVAQVPVSPPPPVRVASVPDIPDTPAATRPEVPEARKPDPPPPVAKRQVPMMMVTEVTYHRKPELRTARIRIEGDKAHLVREGDRYQGLKVKEITSGAITVDVAGTEVSVDVGDSLSFTVSEPDFH